MLTICLRHYPLTLLTVVAILLLSLLPLPEMEIAEDVPFIDKWTHMVMYGGLTLVIWFEILRAHSHPSAVRLFICAFLLPVLLGGTVELIQPFCNRACELLDFVANSTGVVLSTFLGHFVLRRLKP